MRCQSVQALWPSAPPPHQVVAAVTVSEPPTLYTGGSDGAIVWWKLSAASGSRQEVWPMAMLCGHATAVADLEICTLGKDYEVTESLTDKSVASDSSEALISASVDGVLCTWSILRGHCMRRRKMPPWVGCPFVLSSIPNCSRYICIACCCANTGQTQNSNVCENNGGRKAGKGTREAIHEPEGCQKRMSKDAVVIVDSMTLNILQVIFHGFLSIGPVKSMVIVPDMISNSASQSVLMSDLSGRIQSFVISGEKNFTSKAGNNMGKGDLSHAVCVGSTDAILDGVEEVSIASNGRLLLMVFRNRWVIKSTIDGSVAIDKSCAHSFLCMKDASGQSFLAGGMFLSISDCDKFKAGHTSGSILETFVIWNNRGAAIVYAIWHLEHPSYVTCLCQIPPISSFHDGSLCIKFAQMCGKLVRIESVAADFELPMLRETHITIWSPSCGTMKTLQKGAHLEVQLEVGTPNITSDSMAILLGKGGLWDDWFKNSYSCYAGVDHLYNGNNEADVLKGKPNKDKNVETGDDAEYLWCLGSHANLAECLEGNDAILVERSKIVTSAMILSGSSSVPVALVYGFCSGEIKLLKLETLVQKHGIKEGKLQTQNDPSIALRSFRGHTGPILCLASHNMLAFSKEQGCRQLLVSGSMDCTVRIWDLVQGDTLAVMHQHVAPVHQILLPPPCTERPWAHCFITVGDDACVALSSFETLRVERMFPGHPSYPKIVAWDGVRGYIACLCMQFTDHSVQKDVLYIWDIKSGARERILRGGAAHSMFDHFFRRIHINSTASNILSGSTSASSLLFHTDEDPNHSHTGTSKLEESGSQAPSGPKNLGMTSDSAELVDLNAKKSGGNLEKLSSKVAQAFNQGVKAASALSSFGDPVGNNYVTESSSRQFLKNMQTPIKGVCPFPGVAALQFDLFSLMAPDFGHLLTSSKLEKKNQQLGLSECALGRSGIGSSNPRKSTGNAAVAITDSSSHPNRSEEKAWLGTTEGYLLCLSISILHLWGADDQLDKLLEEELDISKPECLSVAAGLPGDRGSLTLLLPGWRATFELWKSCSEYCAMRSLTMVSLAQRMITLSRPCSAASSALASFYTRSFAEKFPDLKPPSLELYACFWQDPSEHVRMAARSLFHCAASRAIPSALRSNRSVSPSISFTYGSDSENKSVCKDEGMSSNDNSELNNLTQRHSSQFHLSEVSSWLDSCEAQDWTGMIGGTSQDARASCIIVGAALAIWYPSVVKSELAVIIAPQLIKLVMAVDDKHSATAAELLAEGMESTWKSLIASQIPHLISDVFLLIECLSGGPSSNRGSTQNPALAMTIRDALIGTLLPSFAMADVLGFLHVIEKQIWTTGSDSPVHLVSLMTLVRIIRGASKAMAPYLDKVIDYILQTIDPGNSVMRKVCLQISMAAIREMVRVFPMVALNQSPAKIAVGNAVGDNRTLSIQVYDLQSATRLKVLDASGPPGLPSLLSGDQAMTMTGGISALSFAPDGEGLVAFSQHGLMIRWWSLGAAWWEKLSRNTVPVQCTKLILVPPWAGFSPNSARASIMASILGCNNPDESQNHDRGMTDEVCLKLTAQNVDLSYRLEWKPSKNVVLLHHGQENEIGLSSFNLDKVHRRDKFKKKNLQLLCWQVFFNPEIAETLQRTDSCFSLQYLIIGCMIMLLYPTSTKKCLCILKSSRLINSIDRFHQMASINCVFIYLSG